jgi:Type II CAAX prenyl endopeptidase Rce1-like
VAAGLPDVWWRFPVLVLSALQDGINEEVLVVGYLLTRLRLLGLSPAAAVAVSAVLRGSRVVAALTRSRPLTTLQPATTHHSLSSHHFRSF